MERKLYKFLPELRSGHDGGRRMKHIVTALEVIAAVLSAIIAIILIVEHHTEWMLICTYWVTVAGRNIGGLFRRR